MKRTYACGFVLLLGVGCSTPHVARDLAVQFDASTLPSNVSACSAMGNVQAQTAADKIALSWNGAQNVSVTIMRKTFCATDAYILLDSVAGGVTSYTDETVQKNYVYWYKLRAVDGQGKTALVAIAAQADDPAQIGCEADIGIEESGVNGLECSGSDGGT
jgi:hypothetical protein